MRHLADGVRKPPPWLRLLVLAPLLCTLSSPSSPGAEPARPQTTWTSEEAGIRVRLLRGWSMESEPGAAPLILREPTGRAVMGLLVEALDPEAENPPDIDKITEGSIEAHRASIDKFKLLSRREVEVDGTPGSELFFRGKRSGDSYRWIQTVFVSRRHKVFVLYSAPTSLYMRYLGDYDQLVRSIRRSP